MTLISNESGLTKEEVVVTLVQDVVKRLEGEERRKKGVKERPTFNLSPSIPCYLMSLTTRKETQRVIYLFSVYMS